MNEKALKDLYLQEIEKKEIDEFTEAHLTNICKANNCSSIEFKDYLLLDQKYQIFQHPAGFRIYQKPRLDFTDLIDTIAHYHSKNKLEYNTPAFEYKTLFEIAADHDSIGMSENGYSFSLKYMIKQFNYL